MAQVKFDAGVASGMMGQRALLEYRQKGDEGDEHSKNCDSERTPLSTLCALFLVV